MAEVTQATGWDIASVEHAIAAAMTGSLRYPAEERPGYIALTLLGTTPQEGVERLTERPADLDAEIADLTALVQSAVNSAASRPTEPPLQAISAYLIAQDEGIDATEIDEAYYRALTEAAEAKEQAAAQLAARGSALWVTAALAFRGKSVKSRGAAGAGSSASPQRDQSSCVRSAALGGGRRRRAGKVPVLGRQASAVLPAVIGTFEEFASNKPARMVDENVMARAISAGERVMREAAVAEKEAAEAAEAGPATASDHALRALGLGGR